MGNTYFCFSDECGDYKPNMTPRQLTTHPYYVRTTLIINATEWKLLNNSFRQLKKKYSLPLNKELKWANLWTIRNYEKNKKVIPSKYDIKYLEKVGYDKLIGFVEESLSLINKLNEKKIIATYTKNSNIQSISEKSMMTFHLQEHMQRIEMELQGDENNLGVLFIDPISNEKNELFRSIYYTLFENGDYIEKYKFIKDSLNIENSHQSVGIQLTDYISGAFNSILRTTNENSYSSGVKMFYDFILPNLRRGDGGAIQGFGIREVPRNKLNRDWLIRQMNNFKPNPR